MMNHEADKVLQNIFLKDLSELRDFDIAFLRARQSYLTDEQLVKYKDFLPGVSQDIGIENMNLDQLKVVAKHKGMKGAHFFKDVEKLREAVLKL
jgi:uncharacterized Fe-S cluster-containing MiaB family protein